MKALPFATALLLTLTLAAPAQANILSWLKGQKKSVTCAPDDLPCLREETVEMVFSNLAKREVEQNTANSARQLIDVVRTQPPEVATAMRAQIEALDDHPSLLENYDDQLSRKAARPDVPLSQLEATLKTGPENNEGYGRQVLAGFRSMIQRGETDMAITLWIDHGEDLWKRGGRAYELVQNWMAEHQVADFARLTNRYALYRRNKQKTYARLGEIAYVQCRSDRLQEGREVLQTVQGQYDKYDWKDPVIALYALSELYAATLYCEGLPAADQLMARIEQQSRTARQFVIEKYPEEGEQAFVLEAMHDTVEIRTSRELAYYHYVTRNDPAAARAAFEAGQATQGIYSIATTKDGALVPKPEQREHLPFETFERDIETIHRYARVPQIGLSYFNQNYEIAALEQYAQSGYYIGDHLEDYGAHLAALWPQEIAQTAAQKSLRIAQEIVTADADYPHLIDRALLRLATLPQPETCALSNARVQVMLDRLPNYRFGDTRVETLLMVLRYLERDTVAEGPCAVPADLR